MTYIVIRASLFGVFALMGIYLIYFYNKAEALEEALQSSLDRADRAQDRCTEYRGKIEQLKTDLIETYGDSVIIEELFKDEMESIEKEREQMREKENEGFVFSVEPPEKPNDKVVNCQFRTYHKEDE